jgi:hypothetical protein
MSGDVFLKDLIALYPINDLSLLEMVSSTICAISE